jgi:hypothetical protein
VENLVNIRFQMIELFVGHLFYFCLFVNFQVAIQNSHQRLDQISVACCHNLFAIDSQKLQAWLNELIEKCLEACHKFGSLFHLFWQDLSPRFNQWENAN